MLQIKVPVRAYKRLIYLAFVSCFFCIVVLHLSISYGPPLNGPATVAAIQSSAAGGIGGGAGNTNGIFVGSAPYLPPQHAFLVGSYELPEAQPFAQQPLQLQQQPLQQPLPQQQQQQQSSSQSVQSDDTSALSSSSILPSHSSPLSSSSSSSVSSSSSSSSSASASSSSSSSQSSGLQLSGSKSNNNNPEKLSTNAQAPSSIDPSQASDSTLISQLNNSQKLTRSASSLSTVEKSSSEETKILIDNHSSPTSSFSLSSSAAAAAIIDKHPAEDEIAKYFNLEPHVDNSNQLSEAEQFNEIEHETNNLALGYWQRAKKYQRAKPQKNGSCRVEFPSLYELEYNNIYWQHYKSVNNSNFYLYGAYYDDRWRGGPLANVRILAMIDRISPPPALCQIWFERISVPIISQATYVYGWFNKWGNYADGHLQPYIVTCPIPHIKGLPKNYYPTSVSLVENRCQKATNNLKIVNDRPEKKQEFAVCVKGLDFLHEDLSVKLVEWIELLRLLGAQKIFLYELEVHKNISKILDYYEKDGILKLTKITLPGSQPNLPGFRHLYLKNKLTNKRQNELIPYNDCLYRNLYTYDYVALLDIDEVIMPLKHNNWSELMAEVQNLSLSEKSYTRASYNVRNVYFLDDLKNVEDNHDNHEAGIPKYLHMLQHVTRSKNYTKPGQYVKCFHNTERAVALHNHFPLQCLGTCTTYSVPVELAHLQHYRKDCVGPLKKSCKEFREHTVRDTTIFKYKDQLISSTTRVLKQLGFFDS